MTRRAVRARASPLFEPLESRILYAADLAPSAIAAEAATAFVQAAQTFAAGDPVDASADRSGAVAVVTGDRAVPRELTPRELVVVDARVPDVETLAEAIERRRAAGAEIDLVILQDGDDAMAVLAGWLDGGATYDAVHLVGHGEAGRMHLGAETLDLAALRTHATAIAGWSAGLAADADLLLYGCDVAASADGRALVDGLSALTGADVAASVDPTGAAAAGGDWSLEYARGDIAAAALLDAAGERAYAGLLAGPLAGPLAAEVRVNTETANTQYLSAGGGQQLASNPAGISVVVWTSGFGADVYARRFNAQGDALDATDVRVNTTTSGVQSDPTVAIDALGNYVVAWTSATPSDGTQIFAQRFAADGTRQGGEFAVAANADQQKSGASVAMNAAGDFVIGWTESGAFSGDDVYARVFAADGSMLSGVTNVAIAGSGVNPFDFDAQRHTAFALAADRTVVAVWQHGDLISEWGVHLRRFAADGAPLGPESVVSTNLPGSHEQPSLAMAADGRAVVAWAEATSGATRILAQRYDADGGKLGGEIEVAQAGIGIEAARSPSVAVAADGRFAVAWQQGEVAGDSGEGILARLYDAQGVDLGTAFPVNQTTLNDQTAPSAVLLGSRLVVAWSGRVDGDNEGIAMRSFAVGTPAITVTAADSTPLAEGTSRLLTVTLLALPETDVTVTLASSHPDLLLDRTVLSFSATNWATPQTVTATARNDTVIDGNRAVSVSALVTSTDTAYNNLALTPLSLVTADDDTVNWIVVDTTGDVADGDTSSLMALYDDRGADGLISLREAILAANATSNGVDGSDRITFDLPGSGTGTILLATALPAVTQAVEIDGHAGPDWGGSTPVIELRAADGAPSFDGLRLAFGSDGSTVRGLAVGGMGLQGIRVQSSGNLIEYNHAGTDATGTVARGNGLDGIHIDGGSSNVVRYNLASGNTESGIEVEGGSGNLIESNRTGTDAAGTAALGNGTNGVLLFSGAAGNVVRDNVIAGNLGSGLTLRDSGTVGNTVTANYIGVDRSGTIALANGSVAVLLRDGASDNLIGGVGAAEGNLIAHGAQVGVRVVDGSGTSRGNAIVSNRFVGTGQGIDLAAVDGEPSPITPNDAGDADVGGNAFQNFPVLQSAVFAAGRAVTVAGTVDSTPATDFRIDVYADDTPDASGHGGGRYWLGAFVVRTGTDGLASFTETVDVDADAFSAADLVGPLPAGTSITATATRLAGASSRDTSEFASNVALAEPPDETTAPPTITNHVDRRVLENQQAVATLRATDTDTPVASLSWAIVPQAGDDAARFEIVGGDALRFVERPDFEAPADADGDNVYRVRVSVTDGENTDYRTFEITVTDTGAATTLAPASAAVPAHAASAGTQRTTDTGGRAVATTASGLSVVVWTDDASGVAQVWSGTYDVHGDPVIAPVRIDSGVGTIGARDPAVAIDAAGRVAIVWTADTVSGSDLRMRVVDAAGTVIGAERTVNTETAGDQGEPAIAANPLGGWVVSWTQGNATGTDRPIVYQAFAADGTPSGAVHTVTSTEVAARGHSAIGVAADGRVVVAYASDEDGGTGIEGGWGVYARVFDPTGAPLTSWLRVNVETIGRQDQPSLSVAADGRFVVAWTTTLSDSGVRARLFDAGRPALTGEIWLNATTTRDQFNPTVAMLADGGFVAAWQSEGQDVPGTDAVILRRFDSAGRAVSTERIATTHVAGDQIAPSLAVAGSRVVLAWSGANASDGDGVALRQFLAPVAGYEIRPVVPGPAGLTVSEAGGSVAFEVVATAPPLGGLTVSFSLPGGLLALSTGSLSFDASNWDTPQRFTVTGVDTTLIEGPRALTLTVTASSADRDFANLPATQFALQRVDDDTVNRVVVDTAADLVDGDTSSLTALWADRGADGAISLREALLAANATANGSGGADRIAFDLPGSGPQTIRLGAALPDIVDAVEIDATADPEYRGTPVVLLTPDIGAPVFDGLVLAAGSDGSQVRGLAIGGFSGNGLTVRSDGNRVEGNHLGVDAAGIAALGNARRGLELSGDASGNRILDNVIGANAGGGILLTGAGTDGNVLQGNFIGTDRGASVALGNTLSGIAITGGASGNLIGGAAEGEGNTIMGNDQRGVHVYGSSTTSDNTIVRNRIDGHALGIDLSDRFKPTPYRTANDALDVDGAGNRQQNTPVLSDVRLSAADTQVDASLASAADTWYRIDFYSDPTPTGMNRGEGPTWLASRLVQTDATGSVAWTEVLPALAYQTAVTATATVSNADGTVLGDTSEFSQGRLVNSLPTIAARSDFAVSEGATEVNAFIATDADADRQSLEWSISGGADGALFTIDRRTGALSFLTAPDFEAPRDADADNTYLVDLGVTDPLGGTADRAVTVRVTDVNEAPVAGAPMAVSIAEDTDIRLSAALGNALSVTDPDLTGAPLAIEIAVDRGRITLAATQGLRFTTGDGTGDARLVFSGAPVDIAAALASVLYQPPVDGHGEVTLILSARDAADAALGSMASVAITILPVNDAPRVLVNGVQEVLASSRMPIDAQRLQVIDVDGNSADIVYTLTEAPVQGRLELRGEALAVGAQFTQADVEADLLAYVSGPGPATQVAVFEVADRAGGLLPKVSMTIVVGPTGSSTVAASAPAGVVAQVADTAAADARPAADGDASNAAAAQAPQAAQAAQAAQAVTGAPTAGAAPVRTGQAAGSDNWEEFAMVARGSVATAVAGDSRSAAEATGRVAGDAHGSIALLRDALPFGSDLMTKFNSSAGSTEMAGGSGFASALDQRDAALMLRTAAAAAWSPVAALQQHAFRDELAQVREQATRRFELNRTSVAATAAVSTTLSIGYVVWMLRGGVLLSSLLASLPAWRAIDPLPVLARLDARGDDGGEDDSLVGMVRDAARRGAPPPSETERADVGAVGAVGQPVVAEQTA